MNPLNLLNPKTAGLAVCTVALTSILSGCALQETAHPGPAAGAAFGGRIMGGQQPVSGSTVYIATIAQDGYGQGITALTQTTTDSGGNYSFGPGAYTCPSYSTPILIEAAGGNPNGPGGAVNSAIVLVAYAGPCGALTPTTPIQINEVTTVAAAYVLRPFANVALRNVFSTSSTNTTGLALAYGTYKNLVSNATGTTPGTAVPTGVSVPNQTIYSLANSLATCVNTTGPTSTGCQALFTASGTATSGSSANTLNAALNIATNPSNNVSDIYNLAGSTPPFGPALTSAPLEWTLAVTHSVGNLNNGISGLDIDASGNVVVATLTGTGTVEEISNSGTRITSTQLSRLTQDADSISDIAVDTLGNIAITSTASGDSSLTEVTSGGTVDIRVVSPDIGTPVSVAYDPVAGTIIEADFQALNVRGFHFNGAIDSQPAPGGNAPGRITRIPMVNAAAPFQPYYISSSLNTGSFAILASLTGSPTPTYVGGAPPNCRFAFDATHYFCTSLTSTTVMEATTANPAATVTFDSGIRTRESEVDGDGQLWLANSVIGTALPFRVLRFSTPAVNGNSTSYGKLPTPLTSYNAGGMKIDTAGNIWVSRASAGPLLELVGVAAPTPTPIAAINGNHNPGARP